MKEHKFMFNYDVIINIYCYFIEKISWYREESLSDVTAVRMMDLPLTEDSLQDAVQKASM